MKIYKMLLKFGFAFIVMMGVLSCADSDEVDNGMSGYGDMQLKLYKESARPEGASRAGGSDVDYLAEIAKVKLSFVFNNADLDLIVPMNMSIGDATEFGIGSDPVKMLSGAYKLTRYILYDKLDRELGYGEPTVEEQTLTVANSNLSIHNIYVNVTERGKIKFNLVKEFDGERPDATRADEEDNEYTFDKIGMFDITLRDVNNRQRRIEFKDIEGTIDFEFNGEDGHKSIRIVSDSVLFINAGSYEIYELWVKDRHEKTLEYSKLNFDAEFEIVDNELLTANVPVKIDVNSRYIDDYVALRNIWVALDGPNWHHRGDGIPDGANWNFNKDIDMWGQQPGVMLHPNGRVATINMGSFNPNPNNDGHGDIPDDLGVLTELIELYLGTHNDRIEEISNTYATSYDLNPYLRSLSGNPINGSDQIRMEYAKDLRSAMHPVSANRISDIIMDVSSREGKPYYVAPVPYAVVSQGSLSNGITSLPDVLDKLTKLKMFFIANSRMESLPPTFASLTEVTDLEIYNCPFMETKIPSVVAELPSLVLLNISVNGHMDEMHIFLDELFSGPSSETLQILYCTDSNLTELPKESVKNLVKLGLLDLSSNKLKEIPAFGMKVSPVQLFFENNLIEKLHVDGNGDFCDMKDMESINCSNNKLDVFPDIFINEVSFSLQSINFSLNNLGGNPNKDGMPDDFGGLYCEVLNLSNNEFKYIPEEFATTKSTFNFFNMSTNKLDSLSGSSLVGLTAVTALDFSGNYLSNVPVGEDGLFGFAVNMPYLNGIDLSRNRYDAIYGGFFNGFGINSFYISDQADAEGSKTLREWPDGIDQYLGLRVLLVDGNDISTIRNMPTLLNVFSVKGNPNLAMEVPFDICRRISEAMYVLDYDLTQIGITGCPILGVGEGDDL